MQRIRQRFVKCYLILCPESHIHVSLVAPWTVLQDVLWCKFYTSMDSPKCVDSWTSSWEPWPEPLKLLWGLSLLPEKNTWNRLNHENITWKRIISQKSQEQIEKMALNHGKTSAKRSNARENVSLVITVWKVQAFLAFKFYVKSKLEILEVKKLPT